MKWGLMCSLQPVYSQPRGKMGILCLRAIPQYLSFTVPRGGSDMHVALSLGHCMYA
ncbi:hypothetical protein CPB84DRAFT_1758979 [Gymnopilus junonius]|uniref:Uncharacterized protein n=1 Tax=Gymnopilus junonius TaxID=109634 RepID=A0A9P5P2E4_GYMJU|nr:hypothetical protein CPB84DRAFT_1758979 [Gymnopilus junonius]